jgi:hypothetical protein
VNIGTISLVHMPGSGMPATGISGLKSILIALVVSIIQSFKRIFKVHIRSPCEMGVVLHACNLSTWKAETGGS